MKILYYLWLLLELKVLNIFILFYETNSVNDIKMYKGINN